MIVSSDRKPWTVELSQTFHNMRYGLYAAMTLLVILVSVISLRFFMGDWQYNKARFTKYSAITYNQGEMLALAQQQIESAVRLSPYQNIYRTEQASIYGSTSDTQAIHRIIDVFRAGIDYDPRDEDMWLNLGNAYMNLVVQARDQNALEEARKAFETALFIDPTFSLAHSQLASIHLNLNNLDKAEKHLNSVLGVNPKDISSYARLANIHEQRGNRENAIAMYRKILEVDPNHQESKDNIKRLTKGAKG